MEKNTQIDFSLWDDGTLTKAYVEYMKRYRAKNNEKVNARRRESYRLKKLREVGGDNE